MDPSYTMGIDLGTQGLRVVVLNQVGDIVGEQETVFELTPASRMEQDPKLWWAATQDCLIKLTSRLSKTIRSQIRSMAVASTSGTVVPLDQNFQPLHPAIMYSDQRSTTQAKKCTEMAALHHPEGFHVFNTSTALAKMVWFVETYPEKATHLHKWVHAADYITGMLSGVWGVSDYTNVLKSGYDLTDFCWPDYVTSQLPLKREWLSEVVPSGTVIGQLNTLLAEAWDLPPTLAITAGITDGCASQIASGAMDVGQWNTTIGTTLVIKGVTQLALKDPAGRLYSHRHPSGYWMPGGAGNIGADWVTKDFAEDLHELNTAAVLLTPTDQIAYPLLQAGERFPFLAPEGRGFAPEGLSRATLFTANMEGVAMAEKYAYELIQFLSGEQINAVYAAGGGSKSDAWLQIRADVLQKPIYRMKNISGAVGAAILAAATTVFSNIQEATRRLTQPDKSVMPQPQFKNQYEDMYLQFIKTMQEKKFLGAELYA